MSPSYLRFTPRPRFDAHHCALPLVGGPRQKLEQNRPKEETHLMLQVPPRSWPALAPRLLVLATAIGWRWALPPAAAGELETYPRDPPCWVPKIPAAVRCRSSRARWLWKCRAIRASRSWWKTKAAAAGQHRDR